MELCYSNMGNWPLEKDNIQTIKVIITNQCYVQITNWWLNFSTERVLYVIVY